VHRFDFDLEGEEDGVTIVGGNIVACHTINKFSPAVAKRDDLRADLDDSKLYILCCSLAHKHSLNIQKLFNRIVKVLLAVLNILKGINSFSFHAIAQVVMT
jgi:hypothetical protein